MSKEIIDLLEQALKEPMSERRAFIEKALTLCPDCQRPPAGELVIDSNSKPILHILNGIFGDITDRKGIGDELYCCDKDIKHEIYEGWRKIIIEGFKMFVLDACDLLDSAEAINADLVAACEEAYEFTKYAGAIKKTNTDEYLKEFFIKGESAQKATIAAIAKAKPKKRGGCPEG